MEAVSSIFKGKKNRILEDLSIPAKDYTDLSPKGSVDEGIRELINEINSIDGLVTTSSCAGRISVFLEGSKEELHKEGSERLSSQPVVPGGKGNGGRWLFVSHEPAQQFADGGWEEGSLLKLFGMTTIQAHRKTTPRTTRFAKFQFEPMILHIMAASLHHAQPVLAAAINAGFRESGVQSLKNLDDPNAFPMVAVRSAGLSLSSLVGLADDKTSDGEVRSMANAERAARFRSQLLQGRTVNNGGKTHLTWEAKEARRNRLRTEGLEKQRKSSVTKSRGGMDGIEQSCQADEVGFMGAIGLDT